MKALQAGELREYIGIQTKTVTADSYNQPIETWATAFHVYAKPITGGGGEFYAAQKLMADTQIVYQVRYDARITLTTRILHDSRTFEILNVNDVDMAHVQMLLSCKEVV